MVAEIGLRRTLSSLCTEILGETVSMTYIRDEHSASTQWPLGEKWKSKASPPGKAEEELVVVDIKLMTVWRGRR